MARSFGRVFATIWDDDDYRAVPLQSRFMFVFLVSQQDLDHAGVIPLRVRRWSRSLAVPGADVEKMLGDLEAAQFVVVDWDAEELLVRSLIRRDEVWKQPNVFKSAVASASACKSSRIKAALLAELRRLDLSSSSREIQKTRDDAVTLLEPFGNPPPTPPGASLGPSPEEFSTGAANPEPDISADTGNAAGHNCSGTLPEGFARGTGELRGKGSSNPPVLEIALPLKPSPSPRPPGGTHRDRNDPKPLWPSAVPDAKTEEGEEKSGIENPDIAALVVEVRKLRPAWATRSIKRALADESVAERPWPMIRSAMLAVARDPESRQPGRLAGDGPWWHEAAMTAAGAARREPETHPFDPDPETRCCRACRAPEVDKIHTRARTA